MGEQLTNFITGRALAAFASIAADEAEQTYVVSFWVNDHEDDPRQPVLTIGTNTEIQVRSSLPAASDAAEARWNFAFWLQNELAVIGGPADPEGGALVNALFTDLGLHLDDEDDSPEADEVGERMTSAFVSCCIDAARQLHDVALPAAFGRDVPVLVHELEYYDAIVEQNERCNPADLVAPFKAWIDSM